MAQLKGHPPPGSSSSNTPVPPFSEHMCPSFLLALSSLNSLYQWWCWEFFREDWAGRLCQAVLSSSLEICSGQKERAKWPEPTTFCCCLWRFGLYIFLNPTCKVLSFRFFVVPAQDGTTPHQQSVLLWIYALCGYLCLNLSKIQLGFFFSPLHFHFQSKGSRGSLFSGRTIARAVHDYRIQLHFTHTTDSDKQRFRHIQRPGGGGQWGMILLHFKNHIMKIN